jgi:tRNA(fMet)-specific endonuclease VapC
MKYLIDTNISIYIMNQHPAKVIQKFKQHEVGDIAVSTITISELQFGVSKSASPEKNQNRLDEFLTPLQILPYDSVAAAAYGEIRHQLEKKGQPIGPLDLLIAAHAIGHGLILITNNERAFNRIDDLKIENWAHR